MNAPGVHPAKGAANAAFKTDVIARDWRIGEIDDALDTNATHTMSERRVRIQTAPATRAVVPARAACGDDAAR